MKKVYILVDSWDIGHPNFYVFSSQENAKKKEKELIASGEAVAHCLGIEESEILDTEQ